MSPLSVAQYLEGAAAALAASRLWSLGLAPRQTALFSCLIFSAVTQFCFASIPVASSLYFWAYIAYIVLNWCLSLWAVRETITLSMGGYPGIRSAARWALYAMTSLSLFLALFATAWLWGQGRNGRTHYFYLQIADRSILFTLSAIVAGLIFYLARYPLHLSHNTYTSCGFFSGILICQALMDLIDSFRPLLYSPWTDFAGVAAGGILYLGWAFRLQPETARREGPGHFGESDEAVLLLQFGIHECPPQPCRPPVIFIDFRQTLLITEYLTYYHDDKREVLWCRCSFS